MDEDALYSREQRVVLCVCSANCDMLMPFVLPCSTRHAQSPPNACIRCTVLFLCCANAPLLPPHQP